MGLHQHWPNPIPLCFSHSRASPSQVSVLSGLIVYSLTAACLLVAYPLLQGGK
jgi:hypothetical protein